MTQGERLRRMEVLFEDHREAVMAYVTRRAPRLAHDVTSETFLLAWRRVEEVPEDPRPWLLGVARKMLANQLRGDRRRATLLLRARSVWEPISERSEEMGLDGELMRAFDSLAPSDREALALVAWDELSYEEAARVMRCSRGAFALRLHRARRQISDALEASSAKTATVQPIPNRTGT